MDLNRVAPAKNRRSRRIGTAISKNMSGWLILLPTAFLIYFIVWRPIIIGSAYSFFKLDGFKINRFVGLKNYINVITDTQFPKILLNTLQYVMWSLIIGFPLPIIAAVMLNEMVHAKGYFKFTMYFPAVVPGIAVSMIWYYIFFPDQSGLLNMLLSHFAVSPVNWLSNKNLVIPMIVLSMTWSGFGGTMIMYLASLQSINHELYEAVTLDGGGALCKFKNVLLPHISPICLLLFVKQIIGVFQVMEQPLAMTGGGPNNASMTLGLQSYFYAFKYYQFENSLALGGVTFVLLIGLTAVYLMMDKRLNDK